MRKTLKISIIVLGVLFCVLGALSIFSESIIRKVVLPEAKKLLGVDVNISSASLNFLSGKFTAKGLTVANPEGFEEPQFITADKAAVRLSLFSLLSGKIYISSAQLKNFTMHIVRPESGNINAIYFAQRLRVKQPKNKDSGDKTKAPPRTPKVRVSNFQADLTVRYTDKAFTTNTIDYSFLTRVSAENIANFGPEDAFGTVSIDGHLLNNPKVLNSVISARVATLSDPAKPTFEANGHISSLHVDELDDLSREIGVYCREFTLDTPFKCKDGMLRGDFKLTLHEPVPLGRAAKKLKNIQLPPVLTVTVPIRGTVEKPRVDWTGAILQSLLDNALGNVDAAMKKIDLSQEGVEKQIENLVDSFKGLFKKKDKK